MILLQDLFNILTTGVYANTTFSGTDNVLPDAHYEKVVNLINLGVLEIHKRFKFLENELTLRVDPAVSNYFLRTDRVAPITTDATQYIEKRTDVDGFLNIVKVTGAYDSSGTELYIGVPRRTSEESFVPTIIPIATDILQISNVTTAQNINIVYQSYPTKIVAATVDPDRYILNISDIIIDPLVSYIAAKTFKPMGSNDSTANADKSASYEQQYELACQKLALYGLTVDDTYVRDTFESNGWV
jgi:hypothetical protein